MRGWETTGSTYLDMERSFRESQRRSRELCRGLNGLGDLQRIWGSWRKFGIGEIWEGWGGWWVSCSVSLEVERGLGRLILGPLLIFGGPPTRATQLRPFSPPIWVGALGVPAP